MTRQANMRKAPRPAQGECVHWRMQRPFDQPCTMCLMAMLAGMLVCLRRPHPCAVPCRPSPAPLSYPLAGSPTAAGGRLQEPQQQGRRRGGVSGAEGGRDGKARPWRDVFNTPWAFARSPPPANTRSRLHTPPRTGVAGCRVAPRRRRVAARRGRVAARRGRVSPRRWVVRHVAAAAVCSVGARGACMHAREAGGSRCGLPRARSASWLPCATH